MKSNWTLLTAAWVVALMSTLSALFIGEVFGQMPCTLCWYQRIFMFPLAIILGTASYRSDMKVLWYALPLAVSGLSIAAYHSLTYSGFITKSIVPCSQGVSCSGDNMTILGGIPLPHLSFIAFFAISSLLLISIRKTK